MAASNTRYELTEQMFAAVGRAITQWSFVEQALSDLFSVCVGSAVPGEHGEIQFIEAWIPMWVFFALESFAARRALVDAAFAAYVYGATPTEIELTTEWAKLSDKARTLSGKRNKLAHWTVIPAQPTGAGAEYEPIAPARLMPQYGSPKYYRETGYNPPGKSLTKVQVGHIENAFCLYAEKVRIFTKKVANDKGLRGRDVLQACRLLVSDGRLDPPVLAGLRREIASRG